MKLNGSEVLVQVFLEQGVDTVFGYPGGAVLNIYDALYKNRDKINHYMTAHEQGAAHAADGYARATGKTGVVIATSGPGATNLVTGIATAYMDSVPMVCITGNVGNPLIGRDSFQEVYIAGITMPITKHNFVVRKVEDLADTLRNAFKIASSGRPGPVLVDIPKDVTAAITDYQKPKHIAEEHIGKEYNLIEIANVINSAKKPVLFIGGGARISKAESEIFELIKKADIPATHTIMASGVLRYDEPLNLGILGMHGNIHANKAVDKADVVIAIGTRFSDRVALNTNAFASRAKIIHIDIDKSEVNKNVTVDYSFIGDVKVALELLLPLIKENEHKEWIEKINSWKVKLPELKGNKLTPKSIIDAVNNASDENDYFVTDVGQHQMWAAQYLNHTKANHFLTSGGLGTMGYGYGAAIGAAIGAKAKRVYHITGDGSFHMNMNEACTAVSYGVPVVSIIMNNAVLGMVRQWQAVFYGRRFSSSEPERVTDYKKVIEGFGGTGFICETNEELADALEKAKDCNGPVWIDCRINREERVLPMIPAGKTVNDTINE